MNEEEELARYYEEHGSDPDLWGPPEAGRTSHKRGQMAATITVRFPAEEANLIRETAKRTGRSYSDVIRQAVRNFASPQIDIVPGSNVRAMFGEPPPPPRLIIGLKLHDQPDRTHTGTAQRSEQSRR
jgi:hypothetical protein